MRYPTIFAVALLIAGGTPAAPLLAQTTKPATPATRPTYGTRPASDGTISVATYNIEHFQSNFLAHGLSKKLPKDVYADPMVKQMLEELRFANDEDNWEVALTITDWDVDPDILVIEEGCDQSNLDYFNQRWLHSAYATAMVFPTNTGDREQNLCMLLKPGFTVVQKRDQYYLEKDTVSNGRSDRLFARGPAFVLVQAPSGYKFWVGVTHQKSKRVDFDTEDEKRIKAENSGKPKEVIAEKIKSAKDAVALEGARWRLREAKRTHEIMLQLAATPGTSDDVILLGDMNDELGEDELEKQTGGDSIAALVGPPQDGCTLVTRQLAERGEISFGGYTRSDFRSFIDHVIVTKAMANQVTKAFVYRGGLAKVASDHYPVIVKFRPDGVGTAAAGQAPKAATTRPTR